MKCNVCESSSRQLITHPFIPGAFTCHQHAPRIKPSRPSEAKPVVVDRDELLGLKIEGLVSLRTYIYFALRIDGISTSLQSLNMPGFCDRWGVSEVDVISAIASLSKKGIVKTVFSVKAQAMTHKERLDGMEKSLES